jgi:minor extracellular serine protease Vpr
MTPRTPSYLLLALLCIALPISSQTRQHYALVLQDPPVTANFATREAARSLQADSYRAQIESRQAALKSELASRNFNVAGSVSTLANAVFVVTTSDREAEMRSLAGVVDVIPMRKLHPTLSKATGLMNAPAAWTTLGGVSNAGAGIKIGIIDSGIDQTHPAFQDSTLKVPAGFPKCTNGQPQDCSYTNNKVIVARSYIRQQSAPSNPSNPAADSLPDDFSPRDRLGHGTGTASVAAANVNSAGVVAFNGMAPKAFLGNYKVLGTGFEGTLTAFEDAVVQALEDAFNDGMDIVSCSLGVIAITPASQDFMASAFEKAAEGGLVIAVSAGNDGGNGQQFPTPTFNVISSPAIAPSVIAVGATINSHVFQPSVSVPGAAANLQSISAQTSDAYYYGPYGVTSAPLIDVQTLGDNGYACSALPAYSLYNAYALIQRSPATGAATSSCTFNTKATNAVNAGAIGIVFYMLDSSTPIAPEVEDDSGNLPLTGPVVMVSLSDGTNLKNYIDAHPGAAAVTDPNGTEESLTAYSSQWEYSPALAANQLASYSSSGPAPGMSLKPDIVATGGFDGNVAELANSGMYVATQSYDPYGEIYSPNGYIAADGTSFAAPMVAGAAALVKQAHPTFTAAQIRSALIDTSSQDTSVDDQGYTRNVTSFGAGRLDANAAVNSTIALSPVSISFGALSGSLPAATPVTITNGGSASATLAIAAGAPQALAGTAVSGISVNVDQKSLTVAAGATATFNVSLSGSIPAAGQYSGNITVQGTGVSLHIPYLFVVSTNVVYDMFGILNGQIFNVNEYACFIGPPSTDLGLDQRLVIKLIDANGAPVANSPVRFAISPRNNITLGSVSGMPACTPSSSGSQVSCNTDNNGVAYAEVTTGATLGVQPVVDATNSGLDFQFGGCTAVIPQPNITSISDAAVGNTTVAPGSYISIYGTNLADPDYIQGINQYGDPAQYVPFPLTYDGVTVSFDVPGAYDGTPADYNGYAGPIVFVGSNLGQINLQVPWELQGASAVQVKVNVAGVANSNVITVPLAQYSPTIFQSSGIVAAVDATTGTIITAANPAHAGDVVELYANGLGPVNNQPATGAPSSISATSLATTKAMPTVTIGGQNATVSYSGLNPGNPGLYQINVTVPSVASGNQTVTLSIGGVSAPKAVIPIK